MLLVLSDKGKYPAVQAVLVVYRVFCRYFGFAADWENWSENDRMLEEDTAVSKNFFWDPFLG